MQFINNGIFGGGDATYLYNEGDECTSITGGWSKNRELPSGSCTYAELSDNIYLQTDNMSSDSYISTSTADDLALSSITLKIELSGSLDSGVNAPFLTIYNNNGGMFTQLDTYSFTSEKGSSFSKKTLTFSDITINDQLDIRFTHQESESDYIQIYKVWVE